MTDKKISDLTELATADAGDLLAVVDVSGAITKKVQAQNAIPAGGVTTAKIADGAVTPSKLSNSYLFRVYRATTQTGFADNTLTTVQWNTESYDPVGMFDNTNYTLTIPQTGYWHLNTSFRGQGTSITAISTQFFANGSTVLGQSYSAGAAAGDRLSTLDDTYHLTSGTTVIVRSMIDVSTGTGTMVSDSGSASWFSGYLVAATS